MQNGVKYEQENLCMTCPTTIASEPSYVRNILSLQITVHTNTCIRQANIIQNQYTTQDTTQDTQNLSDQETSQTYNEDDTSDECPYCDKNGSYDNEICSVCNGTHRLQNISLSHRDYD